MATTKICKVCGVKKPIEHFYKGRLKCKKCMGIESKKRYERNKSIRLRQSAEYRKEHREELLEYFRERYKNNRKEVKMSREIKYRVWDDENKQFADYEDIEECLSCQSRDGWRSSDGMGCCFGINAVEILADCIIEQYTGLKDKNGKEIYEGDIIEEEINFNSKMTDGVFKYKVCWDDNTLSWGLEPIGPDSIHSDLWECNQSIMVIGNIHENPELYKEDK